jgi:hypothetical protein
MGTGGNRIMPAGLIPMLTAGMLKYAPQMRSLAPFVGVGSRPALKGAVGATGIGLGLDLFSNGLSLPFMGGGAPEFGSPVVKSWNTGTAEFYELQNGRIGTVKKNGVIKTWRPYHPVVIPKRWNAKSMRRVERSLKRQQKTAMQIVRMSGGEASATKRAKRVVAPSRGNGKVTMYSND